MDANRIFMVAAVSLFVLGACDRMPPRNKQVAPATGEATGGESSKQGERGGHAHHPHEVIEEVAAPLPGASLYHLPGTWQTDDGQVIQLAKLRGMPRIIALIYTTCEQVCPIIVEDVKRIEKGVGDEARQHLGFVLVSIDPEADTVAKLKAYAEKHNLEPERWSLLRGHPGRVRELAAVLGVRYRKLPNGGYAHGNTITLLDSEGEVVYQRLRLDDSLDPIIAAAKKQAGQ